MQTAESHTTRTKFSTKICLLTPLAPYICSRVFVGGWCGCGCPSRILFQQLTLCCGIKHPMYLVASHKVFCLCCLVRAILIQVCHCVTKYTTLVIHGSMYVFSCVLSHGYHLLLKGLYCSVAEPNLYCMCRLFCV